MLKKSANCAVLSYKLKSIVLYHKITINDKVYYKFGYTDNIKRESMSLRLMKCDLLLVFLHRI
jgi:hypothetical protein